MLKTVCAIFLSFSIVLLTVPATAASTTQNSSASAKKKSADKKAAAKKSGKTAAKSKRGAAASPQAKNAPRANGKMVRKVVMVRGKRRVIYVAARTAPEAPPVVSAGDRAGLNRTRDPLELKSNVVLVIDQSSSQVLLEKNSGVALPIASITKLMTSMVVIDARQDMNEVLEITTAEIDREKNTHSRLRIGAHLTRADMLHIALMSSENRAAAALGRSYPGGTPAFIAAMNAKAAELGMIGTHYVDANGLSSRNVSTASDLAKLVVAASKQPLIRQYSTDTQYVVDTGGHLQQYANTNHLVKNPDWDIGVQKTGYISEAGRCLVMQAKIQGRAIVMVFLDSKGKLSRTADAGRVRKWLAGNTPQAVGNNHAGIPES